MRVNVVIITCNNNQLEYKSLTMNKRIFIYIYIYIYYTYTQYRHMFITYIIYLSIYISIYILWRTLRCDKANHPRPFTIPGSRVQPGPEAHGDHLSRPWLDQLAPGRSTECSQADLSGQVRESWDLAKYEEIWRNMKKWLENGMRNSVQTETN